jgi:hypothetical protein
MGTKDEVTAGYLNKPGLDSALHKDQCPMQRKTLEVAQALEVFQFHDT